MKNQMAFFAAFCHGIGAAINVLGATYNILQVSKGKRDNVKDVLIHLFEFAYHVNAVIEHSKDVNEKET